MWFLIVALFPTATPLGVFAGHVVALGLYFLLFVQGKLEMPSNLKYLLTSTAIFFLAILFSLWVNMNRGTIGVGIIRYTLVPFYWLFGLYAGITDTRLFKVNGKRLLFYVAVIFVLIQLPVVFLQVIGANGLISILWGAEKANSLSEIVRVVGTVGNPNALGILCIFAVIIFVQSFKKKRVWSIIFIVISVLIIIATGSRTSLILLLILPFLHLNKKQLFSKYSFYIFIFSGLVLLSAYYLLLHFQDLIPYMSEILDLISSGKVSSLQQRFAHWGDAIDIYSSSSYIEKFFGLGAGYFPVMDNSYFYILFNYGIVGLITFAFLLISIFITAKLQSNKIVTRLLLVFLVAGTVTDLMISFLFMTIIFYLIGIQAELQQAQIYSSEKELSKSIAYK